MRELANPVGLVVGVDERTLLEFDAQREASEPAGVPVVVARGGLAPCPQAYRAILKRHTQIASSLPPCSLAGAAASHCTCSKGTLDADGPPIIFLQTDTLNIVEKQA